MRNLIVHVEVVHWASWFTMLLVPTAWQHWLMCPLFLPSRQELCRQRMAVKPPTERPEPISSRINSVSSQFSDGGQAVSPSARSSISSWSEEPAHSNMDISTGHMILVSPAPVRRIKILQKSVLNHRQRRCARCFVGDISWWNWFEWCIQRLGGGSRAVFDRILGWLMTSFVAPTESLRLMLAC